MAHVMVGRCISKTKFHELLGSWTLDFNCGGYYDGALSARTRRGITSLCRSTVLIIKGVRESTPSVGKSRARNPTRNPTQKPTSNRPEPGLIKVKIKKKKPTLNSQLPTTPTTQHPKGIAAHITPHSVFHRRNMLFVIFINYKL